MTKVVTVELDAQYRQLREECGLLERPERGMLHVKGTEADEFLQGQLTNDIEALAPGEGCYSALLDRKGHMQADMRVINGSNASIPSRVEDSTRDEATRAYWIDTESVAADTTKHHLETYKVGRKVEIEDMAGKLTIVSLMGPRSAEMVGLTAVTDHSMTTVEVAGHEWLAVGTALGIDLISAPSYAAGAIAALSAAGAQPVTSDAAEILRIESGTPRFGSEMDTATMPAEAGIVERAVSFTKGCYIGQETVARLHYKGKPNRHLRGLRLSAPADLGTPLWLGEKEVGKLGGSCVSPAHGPIALAIVRREAEPGAELRLGEDGVTARVVDLPFG